MNTRPGKLMKYKGPMDGILRRGETYRVAIVSRTVDDEIWPIAYVYSAQNRRCDAHWLKMIQYASMYELTTSWEDLP